MQRPVDNNANNSDDLKKRIREGENIASLFSLVGAWLSPPAPAEGKSP